MMKNIAKGPAGSGKHILILGAGLAGCSAAIYLAEHGARVTLVSNAPSERSLSVMAEGGINAELDPADHGHAQDTLKAGRGLNTPDEVGELISAAPSIVRFLEQMGVAFNRTRDGQIAQRKLGGQTMPRTAFAKSQSGKQIMSGLIQRLRCFEAQGSVQRYSHHEFKTLLTCGDTCCGIVASDIWTKQDVVLQADAVIIACGGMGGMFPVITGSTLNTGIVHAELFRRGIALGNLEFIQYHPTAIISSGKAYLLTEAARAEGGRLVALRDGELWHFMEERHEMGDLAPRDVVSRNVWDVQREYQVYLDLRHLSETVLSDNLRDLTEKVRRYAGIDPRRQLIPVTPAVHFFMSGLCIDRGHRTEMPGLYGAGECDMLYHGANRLGGNALLGGIYGGTVAAQSALEDGLCGMNCSPDPVVDVPEPLDSASMAVLRQTLACGMSIVRDEETLAQCERTLQGLPQLPQVVLGRAMLASAQARRESRGAHYRSDYPETDERFNAITVARCVNGEPEINFEPVGCGVAEGGATE